MNFDNPIVLSSRIRDGHLTSSCNKSDKPYFIRVVKQYTNIVVSDVLRLDFNQTKPSLSDASPASKGVKCNSQQTPKGDVANGAKVMLVKSNRADEYSTPNVDVSKEETETWIVEYLNSYSVDSEESYEPRLGFILTFKNSYSYSFDGANIKENTLSISSTNAFGDETEYDVRSETFFLGDEIMIIAVEKDKFALLTLKSANEIMQIRLAKSILTDGMYTRMKKALTHIITLNKGKVAKEAF